MLRFIEDVVNPLGYEVADQGKEVDDISFIEIVEDRSNNDASVNFVEELFDQEHFQFFDKDYGLVNQL